MGKQKQNKNKLYKGMSGSEVKYLKQSIKYGHLVGEDGKKEVRGNAK